VRRNILAYFKCQVFLNYPYDKRFAPFAEAMTFGVVAAGLLPLTARDISSPDTVRLTNIVQAMQSCAYSAHDLSRSEGEGERNLARMNMPIEMGMGLYHALSTQHKGHRCSFFVPTAHDYQIFASDLAGLDAYCYNEDRHELLILVYGWLRNVVPVAYMSVQPTPQVLAAFSEYNAACQNLVLPSNRPTLGHEEAREMMYRVCMFKGWWDWRENKMGREEFPELPLQWSIQDPGKLARPVDGFMNPSFT
jgi:hypothetical protein